MMGYNVFNTNTSGKCSIQAKQFVIGLLIILLAAQTTTCSQTSTGLLITGGEYEAETAAEFYDVFTGERREVPQLPDDRQWHSQNGNLLCGGQYNLIGCLKLVDGVWITGYYLQTWRFFHTSWSNSQGTLLIGGCCGEFQTTELVKTDGTTEVGTLTLKYESYAACLIDEGDSFLLTGGSDSQGNDTSRISRYSSDSWLQDLDDLNTGRSGHACGWYTDTEGKRTNIVAGGYSYGSYLDSVELLVDGENGWTYGSPLPKPLMALRGVTVMSQFYITGGKYYEGDIDKYEDAIQLFQEYGWTTVGHMNVSRAYHAVSVVNFDDVIF